MKTKTLQLLIVFSFVNLTASAQQFTCGIFTFDAIITPPTCNGDCDGSVLITNISGGTPSYTTFWSNGSTTPNPIGLCTGDYTLYISDAVGDTCSMVLNVSTPLPITFSLVVTNVSCYGFSDGSICVSNLSGGNSPYAFQWNTFPPQTTSCMTNASAGSYTVCVTDANGCVTCDTATVLEPAEIQVSENVTDASCPSCCDGEIVLTPIGGTPPYNFFLTPGGSQINLCPDTYNWCVTDANGCSTCDTVVVSFPTAIKTNAEATVFSIFPNPANSVINIEQTNTNNIPTFELSDITGKRIVKKLLKTKSTQLDISSYPKGIYFYKLLNNKETITGKLIIGN